LKALRSERGWSLEQARKRLMSRDFGSQDNMLNNDTEKQINQCLNLLKAILGQDLLGVYLYGSSIIGGLQKYSDIDLFVVSERSTTLAEKAKLSASLLHISGIYMKSSKLPIEMTMVVKSQINPWHYPPSFDFQYGDWLRKKFASGIIEPWSTKEMPDLALLITQVLLASKTLLGPNPDKLLCKVPYHDFMIATTYTLQHLMSNLNSDTRNVLLTYARIWSTLETDAIRSKPAAADWAFNRLPKKYQPVMKRAVAICRGQQNEHWHDIQAHIKPCADFMVSQINKRISVIRLSDNTHKSIKLAE
jgi:predicted nucleotidyltransferase